jgi:hypothetical protein
MKENVAKIMIALGAVFLALGVLTLTTFYAIVPMFSLPLGIILLILGFFAHMGLFSIEWRSPNGLAMILLCVSVAFFALAVASTQFQGILRVRLIDRRVETAGGFPAGKTFEDWYFIETYRPFVSQFILCTQLGVAFFVASVAVKTLSRFLR